MGSYGGVLVTGPLVGELPDLPGLDPDELDPWPPVDP